MLGSLILYLKGMRIVMFQLFGFYYTLFEDSYKEIIIRNPKKVGYSGLR